jgi:hypothetical protein
MASAPLTFEPFDTLVQSHDQHWFQIPVSKVVAGGKTLALVYRCYLNEDWDGAPRAYGWNRPGSKLQQGLAPKEHGLGNATRPHTVFEAGGHNFEWVGIISMSKAEAKAHPGVEIDDRPALEALVRSVTVKKDGKWVDTTITVEAGKGFFPVVQGAGTPAPGYYVSPSGARTDSKSEKKLRNWDQNAYIDASTAPYAVLPKRFGAASTGLGDLGVAIRNKTGKQKGFFFGDTGNSNKLGEVSGFLFEALQGIGSKNNEDFSTFIAFPGSGFGSTGPDVVSLIPGGVKARLQDLSLAPNAEDLVLFLALHADRAGWARIKDKDAEKNKIRVTEEYQTILKGLVDGGFVPPIVKAVVEAVQSAATALGL